MKRFLSNICLIFMSLLLAACQTSKTTPTQSGPSAPLVGTRWQLLSFTSNRTTNSAVSDSATNIIFDPSGQLSGNTGCNNVIASFVQSGEGQLAIFIVNLTTFTCPNVMQAQEDAVLDGLRNANHYEIEKSQLTIITASGATTLIFKAVK